MPMYRIVVKGTFFAEIHADDDDDAWTAADDIDIEDMRCANWETVQVEEIGS